MGWTLSRNGRLITFISIVRCRESHESQGMALFIEKRTAPNFLPSQTRVSKFLIFPKFLCALNGFRAQFQHAINLANNQEKAVIFKPTAVGLGVFGNAPSIVAKAFYQVAKEREAELKKADCIVRFQVFRGEGPSAEMAKKLKLSEFS